MAKAKTVFIVDDDVIFSYELHEALALSGYNPVVVNDPAAAFDQIKAIQPDVVLMDLNMPGKNGFEIAKALNLDQKSCNIPVIAMTGQYRASFEEAFPKFGFKQCIKKPFYPLDVISVIESC